MLYNVVLVSALNQHESAVSPSLLNLPPHSSPRPTPPGCHRALGWTPSWLFSCLVLSDTLRPRGLQHTRPPCPLPTPGASQTHVHRVSDAIQPVSSSAVPYSSCLQSFPTSGSFPVCWLFTLGGQSIGASTLASVLSMNIQD